ncbi:translation elongation factor Ts [Candidatus Saccharibacteria bacterium RIFCSPHIGHO2_12_FULL_49_19]|nr:MAG: translation elongation factor Ts [Candidatus Saccharibacteria bacterium RIFCSPHIGHO2_12_FULL_49_19]
MDIENIKKLREMSGVGMTDAKKALVDSSGDFDKALEEMKKKGLAKAVKRGEREARCGLIGSYSHDGRIGVLVEVNCETDFVAKTDEFKELVKDLTLHIAASEPEGVDDLLKQPFVKNPEATVDDVINGHIAKLGENIVVRRLVRFELGEAE